MAAMNCLSCTSENPDGAWFCMSCGNSLANVCLECATELPAEARFCLSGGAGGIGSATAKLLASEGAAVVIGDLLEDEGRATEAMKAGRPRH